MTLPIGSIVEYHGVKLKVEREIKRDTCIGCYAIKLGTGLNVCADIGLCCGYCGMYSRADGVGVIFKKIKNDEQQTK